MAFKWRSDKDKRTDDSEVVYGETFGAGKKKTANKKPTAPKRVTSFRPINDDVAVVTPFVPEPEPIEEPLPVEEAKAEENVAEQEERGEAVEEEVSVESEELAASEEESGEEESAEETELEAESDEVPVVEPEEVEEAEEPEAVEAPAEAEEAVEENVISADPADTVPAEVAEEPAPVSEEEMPVEQTESEQTESEEAVSEQAEGAEVEAQPVEESAPAEPIAEEAQPTESAEPVAPTELAAPAEGVVAEAQPVEESPSSEENGEEAFVMDEDYMKAFMEEGAMDDYIYGGNIEYKQELLEQIADNAETLAEEGAEFQEQKEQEAKEKPRFNERGEPLNEDGKAVLKRSLENKLILADTRERRYYNKLKNDILAYEGVKAELQTATEVFRRGKQSVARLSIAGFTRIYFALDPVEFDIDRYKQADRSEVEFEDTKMMLRVRNDDEYAIALELLELMMGALNVNRLERPEQIDYLPRFPRRSDAVLDKKGKYLSLEEKDEQALIKEKRAEERKAAGLSEEPEEEYQPVEVEQEPLTILPLTLENKIHQCPNTIKLLYSKLKNELLSYKSVKGEMTTKNDNFKTGKKLLARLTIVAEVVRLYLALEPKKYPQKTYKYKDASDQLGYEGTKIMLKVANERDRSNAIKMIVELMKENGLERNKRYAYVPFAEKHPYIKNAVFKGEEDKPYVQHEGEEYVDIYGELTEHLREQMGATDAWGVPKGYKPDDGLTARDLLEIQRNKAKTLNAGVALASPIVFFYDAAINEEGVVQYLNVHQVLNDKFLGKMIPQEYFAIAEGSSRIEELNYIALDNIVKDCNENPDVRFVVKISCRLLLKQETLTKLVDKMRTENHNLILAFDCAMLEAVGYVGISAINTLKSQGALIMIDNAESASMRVLTEYEFDYLRLDARYYSGDSSKRIAHLDMVTGYAAVQNIVTTSIYCEHKEEARILLDHGVKVIQGDAVARPMRLINLALTNIKPVPKVKENGEVKE